MKTILIIFAFLAIMLTSCNERTSVTVSTLNCTIIDTTNVSQNGFNVTVGYSVIIKMDSTYYSAYMDTDGEVTTIYRTLKIRE